MFSIIIPLYNKAPYVAKTIQSVLTQTYQEFEVIIIDDGSIDESYEVAKQFCESSNFDFTLIKQENTGVSTARNNGVKHAKYDYIAFLDADDWWAPTYLEEMKGLIEEYAEAGVYGSSYYKVKNNKYIPANIGVEKDFHIGLINYFQVYAKTMWMPLTSITAVVKKSIFGRLGGFKPQLKLGEDFDLWVRIALNYPVAFLNKPLAYYNQDVELINRAVGARFYRPEEHMLYTDYGNMMENSEFRFLFERLALYGLLSYSLNGVNKIETKNILDSIEWSKHESKYSWYYKKLPKWMVAFYFQIRTYGSTIKQLIKK